MKWISANINEAYTSDKEEGIDDLNEGDIIIIQDDGKWYRA